MLKHASHKFAKLRISAQDLRVQMRRMENFDGLAANVRVDEKNAKKLPLVIDIEGVFIDRVIIRDHFHYETIRQHEGFKHDFFIVEMPYQSDCCDSNECFCNLHVFRMRPNLDEFILSVSQYFELIAFTNMPRLLLYRICQ